MNRILKRIIAIGTAAVITAVCVSGCNIIDFINAELPANPFEDEVLYYNQAESFDDMTMPDIIGMSLDEVSSKYPDLNLEVERQYSDEYGENTVIDQKISAGRTIRKSAVVNVTVSNGTQKIEIPDSSSTNDDTMTMPDIIGMSLDEVGSKYPDLNLEVERQYSDEYAENTVIDQKIPAGRTIRKSAVVNVTVSNGTQKIEIPDLSGTNIEEAMDKLEKMELIPKMIYVENDETDKDAVIYTEPAAHSEVAKNTLVKLYVSMGKPVKAVNVPKFVGLTIEEAQKEAENTGLILKIITEASDEYESGTVIKQSIEENSVVYTNTEIEVTVCE